MEVMSKDFLKQLTLTLVVSLGYFSMGLSRGWSGPALPSLNSTRPDIHVDPSWVTSVSPLGGFFGGCLGGPSLHVFGRKRSLQAVALVFGCGCLLIGSSVNFAMLLVGRFVNGLCGGVMAPAAQVYISETSRAEFRGVLGSLPSIFNSLGILVSFLIGTWLPWNYSAYVISIFPFILLFLVAPLPESPSWLFLKGKQDEAEAAMKWLNKKNYQSEILRNRYTENDERSGSLKDNLKEIIFDRRWAKPFAISIGLFAFQYMTGSSVVILYSVSIFRAAKTNIDDYLQAIIIALVQLVTSFISLFMIDKVGRKQLLYVSGFLMGVSSCSIGIHFYIQSDEMKEGWKIVPLLGLILYMIGYSFGYLTLPGLIRGEILPRKQRSVLSSASSSISFLIMWFSVKTYPDIARYIGEYSAFWIYSGFSFFSCIFVWWCIPETKGQTLKEIEDRFDDGM